MPYIKNIYSKHNLEAICKMVFTLWFYNFCKKMGKKEKDDDTFLTKKNGEKAWLL